jgi:catechol 2,3-dioxygenase-like lactoylglutathione lyase family enzyme
VIHHVALEVRGRDVAACERFWRLLGFARVEPPPSLRDRAVWLERRGTQIHLLLATRPVIPRNAHVAVAVDDYEKTLDRLLEGEHDPEPRPEHWGAPRCFVRSPAGHLVEVMASPPGGGEG